MGSRVWCSVALILVLSSALAGAQPSASYEARFEGAMVTISENKAKVDDWQQSRRLANAIFVSVAALGFLTMVLQAGAKPWTKGVTAGAGALVSALTVVSSAYLPADAKTLNFRVTEGRRLLQAAEGMVKNGRIAPTEGDKNFFLDEAARRLKQFAALESQTTAAPRSDEKQVGVAFPFEATVFAQAQSCGCLERRTTPAGFLDFCGEASSTSAVEAKAQASANAVQSAAVSLARSAGKPVGPDVSAYARSVLTEVDSCATSGAATIRFAVLMRLPATLSSASAQTAFAVQAPVRRVKVTLARIHVIRDGSPGGTGWVFKGFGNDAPLFELAKRNYRDREGKNDIVPDASKVEVELDVRGSTIAVLVRGQRTFGLGTPDTAVGTGTLTLDGKELAVPVQKTKGNDSGGSFIFYFTATAL